MTLKRGQWPGTWSELVPLQPWRRGVQAETHHRGSGFSRDGRKNRTVFWSLDFAGRISISSKYLGTKGTLDSYGNYQLNRSSSTFSRKAVSKASVKSRQKEAGVK